MIPNYDAETLYDVPLMLQKEGLDKLVCEKLHLGATESDMTVWSKLTERFKHPTRKVKIALVGKYVDLRDAYISISEALAHAGIAHAAEVEIEWIYSGDIKSEEMAGEMLGGHGWHHCPGRLRRARA